MRKTFTLLVILLIGLTVFAQTPQSFNYQAVLRNTLGNVLSNQEVEIEIDLLQGSVTGTTVFSETHQTTTNDFGLVNLQIGSENTTGMESLDWSSGPYFIQVSVDGTVMGTSQLLSVPYALYSQSAENDQVDDADADPENELQDISFSGTELSISDGSTVDLSVLQQDETDPVFLASEAANVTASDITNLGNLSGVNTGDQDLSGLLSKSDVADSIIANQGNITITESQISDLDHFTGDDITGNETAFDGWDKDASDDFTTADETDPVFSASEAVKVTASDITNLGNLSGVNTGDQDLSGLLLKSDVADSIIANQGNITISESQISDLDHFTTTDETDPVFSATVAAGITAGDTANWNKDISATNELQVLSISNDTIFLSDGGSVKLPDQSILKEGALSENHLLKWDGDSIDGSLIYEDTNIGIGTESPDSSAILEISSTSRGVLFPRLTKQQIRDISDPANSLMVFCSDENQFYSFIADEFVWKVLAFGSETIVPQDASYTIGTGSSCNNTSVNGDYYYGLTLDDSNFVTLDVEVSERGSWSIKTGTINGYSFSGSGIFASLGTQQVVLYASGTPIDVQTDNFTATDQLGGTTCSFSVDVVVDTVVSATGKVWMARNLGANSVATSSDDADSFGNYYQWGRAADGHEHSGSSTSGTQATTAEPNQGNAWDGLFIKGSKSWLASADNTLWQGTSGANIPCPSGFRLPTAEEWQAELAQYSNDLYNSPLKLPAAGYRYYVTGDLYSGYTVYWTSDVDNDNFAYSLLIYSYAASATSSTPKATGVPIRCIKIQDE